MHIRVCVHVRQHYLWTCTRRRAAHDDTAAAAGAAHGAAVVNRMPHTAVQAREAGARETHVLNVRRPDDVSA